MFIGFRLIRTKEGSGNAVELRLRGRSTVDAMENDGRVNAESSFRREKACCGLVELKDKLISDQSNETGADNLIHV